MTPPTVAYLSRRPRLSQRSRLLQDQDRRLFLHPAEWLPAFRLLGRLFDEILRRAELLVKLPVENVAIRHDDQRRVVHLRLLQDLTRVAGHRDAFARVLCVPEDAHLVRTGYHLP